VAPALLYDFAPIGYVGSRTLQPDTLRRPNTPATVNLPLRRCPGWARAGTVLSSTTCDPNVAKTHRWGLGQGVINYPVWRLMSAPVIRMWLQLRGVYTLGGQQPGQRSALIRSLSANTPAFVM